MTETKHLWECDHPYHCSEGSYFFSPMRHINCVVHEEFSSWAEFKSGGWFNSDRDLNLLFRWDWQAWHLEFPDDYPDEDGRTEHHVLQLYFMLQRKARNQSVHVIVTPEDEPEIRAWLTECAKTVSAIWAPILDPSAA